MRAWGGPPAGGRDERSPTAANIMKKNSDDLVRELSGNAPCPNGHCHAGTERRTEVAVFALG